MRRVCVYAGHGVRSVDVVGVGFVLALRRRVVGVGREWGRAADAYIDCLRKLAGGVQMQLQLTVVYTQRALSASGLWGGIIYDCIGLVGQRCFVDTALYCSPPSYMVLTFPTLLLPPFSPPLLCIRHSRPPTPTTRARTKEKPGESFPAMLAWTLRVLGVEDAGGEVTEYELGVIFRLEMEEDAAAAVAWEHPVRVYGPKGTPWRAQAPALVSHTAPHPHALLVYLHATSHPRSPVARQRTARLPGSVQAAKQSSPPRARLSATSTRTSLRHEYARASTDVRVSSSQAHASLRPSLQLHKAETTTSTRPARTHTFSPQKPPRLRSPEASTHPHLPGKKVETHPLPHARIFPATPRSNALLPMEAERGRDGTRTQRRRRRGAGENVGWDEKKRE
ncbi:hypothetical protein B0H16DRAFT_1896099 [Mycena metata]|uniref:Uncharacterized protein n=1 Tax=Mycena metata TaxID=1033252 RepID=A0AAD7HKD2_9AGAR|nr:hypothetical protein B0H16DRAFT_1896099 [Mycena metata]